MGVFFDAAGLESQTESPLESRAAHRLGGGGGALSALTLTRKEQSGMALGLPLLAEPFQSALGQGHIAITVVMESFP